MRRISHVILAAAICLAGSACQKSGNDEPAPAPSKPTTTKDQTQHPKGGDQGGDQNQAQDQKTVPSPTAKGSDAVVVSSVLKPDDELTSLLTNYLSSKEPAFVPVIADQIIDEIFSEDELIRPKIFEVQQGVAKVVRAGIYTQESANRIAFLQAGLQSRIKEDARGDVLRDGIFIVGTSAAIGVLAGTNAYEQLPKALPAMQRGISKFASAARERFSSAYAKVKEEVSLMADKEYIKGAFKQTGEAIGSAASAAKNKVRSAATSVTDGVKDVTARARMPVTNLAYRNLEAFGLEPEHLLALQEMERVPNSAAVGYQFQNTDMAGFRFASIDQWEGRDLGINRRILFQIKRMAPGAGANYVLSPEVRADVAGAIAARLRTAAVEETGEASKAGRFVYFLDPRNWSITPVRTTYAAFKTRMAEAGHKIKPLFAMVDWPTATGTAITSGAIAGVWYYTAYDHGLANGEQYATVDLEKLVPAVTPPTSNDKGKVPSGKRPEISFR